MKDNFTIIIPTIILVLILNLTPIHAYGFKCPNATLINVWEPLESYTDSLVYEALRINLTVTETYGYGQGYWIAHYYDNDDTDDSFGMCSRSNWIHMARNAGFFVLDGHGDTSSPSFIVAYNPYESKIIDKTAPFEITFLDYNGDGTIDNYGLNYQQCLDSQGNDSFEIYITPGVLGTYFQSTLEQNNAIVLLSFCKSANGAGSCLNYCYGNIGFGYDDDTNVGYKYSDALLLTGYMSGLAANGEHREAIDAYDNGKSVGVVMGGILRQITDECIYKTNTGDYPYDGMTLCPSIEETGIYPDEGGFLTEGEGAGYSGIGRILFDSHCDTTIDPWDLIDWDSTPSESGFEITDVYWSGIDGYEDTELIFEYCALNNYSAIITACAFSAFGCQASDGGTSFENGVAEIGDPYYLPISQTE